MKHRGRWIALGGILAILAAAIVAVCVVDPKYDLHYTVSAPEVKANTLEVVLEVHNSPLSRGKTVSLYIGDKDVTVQSCMGADGVSLPAHQTEDFLTFELGRGADVSLVYQVPLGASGKHGQRGMVQEEYCVFDGGQALLLPMEFYQDGFPQDEAVVRSLRVSLKAREDWTAILPFEEPQQRRLCHGELCAILSRRADRRCGGLWDRGGRGAIPAGGRLRHRRPARLLCGAVRHRGAAVSDHPLANRGRGRDRRSGGAQCMRNL